MPQWFDPHFHVLPPAQREVWAALSPAADLGFVLYGGTAVALQLGHRRSLDFDFFSFAPLSKAGLIAGLPILATAELLQEAPNTFVASAVMPSGPVKLSFFGRIRFGRLNEPLRSRDGVLLAASLEDLLTTKLMAMLDRAEAKDYVDVAAMLRAGASLPRGISAARAMFNAEPRTILTAIGYFGDGDVASLPAGDRQMLLAARDAVRDLPEVTVTPGSLAGAAGGDSDGP